MECKDVKETLSDYIDDKCDFMVKESIGAHLSKCKGCSERLFKLKSTVSFLKNLPDEDILDNENFYYGLSKKLKAVDLSFLKKVLLLFNFQNVSVAVGGILLGVLIGMGIMLLQSKNIKDSNIVVVKTHDINKASNEIEKLMKKFESNNAQTTSNTIEPKRYEFILKEDNYNDFVRELNKIGPLQNNISVNGKLNKAVRPIRINLELHEIK